MSAHTPGPWSVSENVGGYVVLPVGSLSGVAGGIRNEPDARLIAQAPRMLNACTFAHDVLSRPFESLDAADVATARRILFEAIRKATEVTS